MALSFMSRGWTGVFLVAMLGGSACYAVPAIADSGPSSTSSLNAIVVKGKKNPETADDAAVRRQVETAMEADHYFYGDHVMVTVRKGVAFLQGVVFDDWDVRAAIRITKKIAGVKRVVNELEIGGQP
jgi:osmotically-inducible protein OsmY